MTIMDALLVFDPNPTAITASAASTNVIDWLSSRDMGVGDMTGGTPKILCQIVAAFAGGTSLQVQYQTAVDNGSGAPGTWYTAAQSDVIPLAELVLGARLLEIDLPRTRAQYGLPRFSRLNYVVVGTMTGGAVNSAIVLTDQAAPRKNGYLGGYPAGVVVNN